MNTIAGYGAYQKNIYDNSVKGKREKETGKTGRKENISQNNSQVKLSEKAEKLLQELRNTYGNMDFFVADYETDEEAQSYLSRGTKEYSVLIDPETLEAMAADSEMKKKYIGIIEDATGQLDSIKNQLEEEEDTVVRFGISVDKDGTVSYFAELEKMSEKQRERIEKAREEKEEERAGKERQDKKTDKKRAEGKPEDFIAPSRVKRTKVTANSVEELLEQIKSVDWDNIKNETSTKAGGKFDFCI